MRPVSRLLHQVLLGNTRRKHDVICTFSTLCLRPQSALVCAKGCCHVTAKVTCQSLRRWPSPSLRMLFAARGGVALAARWLSSLLGSPSLMTGTKSDFLLWMTTTLTSRLYWHQPLQNNKHVMRCFLFLDSLLLSPLGLCRNIFLQSATFPGGKPASVNVLFSFWMRAVPPKLATSALATPALLIQSFIAKIWRK